MYKWVAWSFKILNLCPRKPEIKEKKWKCSQYLDLNTTYAEQMKYNLAERLTRLVILRPFKY